MIGSASPMATEMTPTRDKQAKLSSIQDHILALSAMQGTNIVGHYSITVASNERHGVYHRQLDKASINAHRLLVDFPTKPHNV